MDDFTRAFIDEVLSPPPSKFDRYRTDALGFVVDVLRAEPDAWQREALGALGAGKYVTVRSGHGVGKTAFLAWSVIWWLLTRDDAKVPCTAPTAHQLEDLLWSEIQTWISRAGLGDVLRWEAKSVRAVRSPRTIFAVARVASTVEALAGFHAKNLLYVCDEASGIEELMMMPVQGALSTEGAQLVMVGNPTRGDGYFAERFTRVSMSETEFGMVGCDDRAVAIGVNAEKSHRVSEESRTAWALYGRDSDIYRVRVLGLPPLGEANGFIPGELVRQAVERGRLDVGRQEGVLCVGVDVARFGDDDSAIVARRGISLPAFMQNRHGLSNPDVAAWVLEVVRGLMFPGEPTVTVRVDDNGIGGGVTDMLRVAVHEAKIDINVIPCNFGAAGDRFYYNATGLWWASVRKLLQDGLPLPDDDRLCRQLTDRLYYMNLAGKIVLETKDQMKKRGVASPDVADAFMLAYNETHGPGSAFLEYWKSTLDVGDSTVVRRSSDPLAVPFSIPV